MKVSRLMQLVFVSGNVFLAMPGLAASLPASSREAPVALCGGKDDKGDKGDKDKGDKDKGDKDKKGDKDGDDDDDDDGKDDGDSEQPAAI